MSAKYCYWSVADGTYGAMIENCVRTARQAGVFKEFHVLTDRPLAGCECYDCFRCDKADGLFKLHYLKVGMSKLLFDYFIWLDADTVFTRNPVDILSPIGHSPIHVPLEVNLSALTEDQPWHGRSCFQVRDFFRKAGVLNSVFLSRSAFWTVHHDAIDEVHSLALEFAAQAKSADLPVTVDQALGYAMQILCADPERHHLANCTELWATDDAGYFSEALPDRDPWPWRHPLLSQTTLISPAIVHLPRRKVTLAGGDGVCPDPEPFRLCAHEQ